MNDKLTNAVEAELIEYSEKLFNIRIMPYDVMRLTELPRKNKKFYCHLDSGGFAKMRVKKILNNPDGSINIIGSPLISRIVYNFLKGIDKIGNITVSQWAEKYRILSSETGNTTGRYKLSHTPYAKLIMDLLTTDSEVEVVVFMKSAQCGGSEIGNNWLGYIIDVDPAPTILMTSSTVLARAYSKSKIRTLLSETKRLFDKVYRGKKDNMLLKSFKGGSINIIGANSASNMRSLTARNLFLDEVDSYPRDIQGEGDTISVIKNRVQTAGSRAKIFIVSTPSVKGFSKIEEEFLKGDQCKFHVPCPHCDYKQELVFERLKYRVLENNPKLCDENSVYYECAKCKTPIEEKHKHMIMQKGDWFAQSKDNNPKVRSFHINALYAPPGQKTWTKIVNEWLECKDDEIGKKSFYNTTLGLTYKENHLRPDPEKTYQMKGTFSEWTCPDDVIYINAGCDTQNDRLAYCVVGYGSNEQIYILAYGEEYGDTSGEEVYERLIKKFKTPIKHDAGVDLYVSNMTIDMGGHRQPAVIEFASKHPDFVYVVKGRSDQSYGWSMKPTTEVDKDKNGNKLKNAVQYYMVNTLYMKKTIYRYIGKEQDGKKCIYFNKDLEMEFFNMLCSEDYVPSITKGRLKEEFVKFVPRNESLDCLVYSLALAKSKNVDHDLSDPQIYANFYKQNITRLKNIKEKVIKTKPIRKDNGFEKFSF